MSNKGRIQSIDRAIAILKCFSLKNKELKLTDIAERLDLNKSTTHGIVNTLRYHGLLDQDDETQKYRLGLYLMELSNLVENSLDVVEITKSIIEDVSRDLNETVHIGMLDNSDVIYINKEESNQSMRIYTSIGTRNPAYCTGIGKAMLAFQDLEEIIDKIPDEFEAITENTITSKDQLIKELQEIRRNGYAIDNEENVEGLSCVAAPIFNHMGDAIYGISVSGPTIRMYPEKIEDAKKIIKDAAEKISYKLGFRK